MANTPEEKMFIWTLATQRFWSHREHILAAWTRCAEEEGFPPPPAHLGRGCGEQTALDGRLGGLADGVLMVLKARGAPINEQAKRIVHGVRDEAVLMQLLRRAATFDRARDKC